MSEARAPLTWRVRTRPYRGSWRFEIVDDNGENILAQEGGFQDRCSAAYAAGRATMKLLVAQSWPGYPDVIPDWGEDG